MNPNPNRDYVVIQNDNKGTLMIWGPFENRTEAEQWVDRIWNRTDGDLLVRRLVPPEAHSMQLP